MCRIEANPVVTPPAWWETCPPCAVSAAPVCPAGGFNEHRLAERAVVVDLLGAAPGSVPQWVHVAVAAARVRAEGRMIEAALAAMSAARTDYGQLAARDTHTGCSAAPMDARPVERPAPAPREIVPGYAIARRKWPVGGLIDLVV